MFITSLLTDPLYYVSVVVTVIVSIILHELAHGWAAIWQGDDTPIRSGHMTVNPLVHMGGFSLAMLVFIGISYGQMPVNPNRFRGRYGDAMVSAAGPAMNLVLALVGLTILGVWQQINTGPVSQVYANAQTFLWIFGRTNIVLCLFNLFPVPPLDGASILANFHRGYARLVDDPNQQQVFMFIFFFALFMVGSILFGFADSISAQYLGWLAGAV